jgi:hypothetical protein
MALYQLIATGEVKIVSGSYHISSKRVFDTREKAERYIPDFRKLVTTDRCELDLSTLKDDKSLSIKIVELELIEDLT